MPGKKDSPYPQDWFTKGGSDIAAAGTLVGSGNLGVAAFHIQQALEKYLKGYLLSKGWKLRRIHDLEELLDEAVSRNPGLEKFRALCQTATEYYIEERYPSLVSSELNSGELKDAIKETGKFMAEIVKMTEH